MIELPDDELDKLFRKSAEEPDPYFDPNDWNDLKSRLDAHDGIRTGGWLRKWWPLGVVLLFIAGGLATYIAVNNHKVIPGDVSIATGSQPNTEYMRGVGEKGNSQSDDIVAKKSEERGLNVGSEKSVLTKSNSGKILPPSRSKAGGVFLEPNRSIGKVGEGAFSSNGRKKVAKNVDAESDALSVGARSTGLKDGRSNNEFGKSELPRTAKGGQLASDDVNNTVRNGKDNVSTSQKDPSLGNTGQSPVLDVERSVPHSFSFNPVFHLPGIETVQTESEGQEAISATEVAPSFAVRFGYSPDLSSVGMKDFTKPGASVSLLAEYQIRRRLYLQSGVIWSNKIYNAVAADYNIPKRAHYYGPPSTSAEGICKVFELPVNLRYDIFQGKTSRWFASAGVSSYHMNAETYVYHFENEQDPKITEYDRGWKGSTGWWWLSHLNASAGYEYRISKQLSLMAEPYVRIPIKGVGYGKVKLVTTGVWLSVRYTPFHK